MTRMITAFLFFMTMGSGAAVFADDDREANTLSYEELEFAQPDSEESPGNYYHRPFPPRSCFVPRQIRAGYCHMTLRTPVYGPRIPHGARVTYATHGGYYYGWSQLICRNGRLMIWQDNVRWCGIRRR